MFYKQDLCAYRDDININWQAFREEKLNDYDVELVFTMNINSLDRIYTRYSKMNQDTEYKAHN